MARYVSRFANDCRILRNEVVKLVSMDGASGGRTVPWVEKPALIAQFQPGLESNYERTFAIHAFTGRLTQNEDGTVSFGEYLVSPEGHEMRIGGALPDTLPRTVSLPGMTQMLNVAGYDITQKMGTFDTDDPGQPWSEEDKLEAERLLDKGQGVDYFKVGFARMDPPWPSYDEMRKGAGSYQSILKMVKDMGFNPAMIVRYEETLETPSRGIINAMETYLAELEENAKVQAALTAVEL